MKLTSPFVGLLLLLASAQAISTQPGESIVLDPATGDYVITYWNADMEPPGLETTTFVPATKIVPFIQSRFSIYRAEHIVYRYSVTSGA